MKRQEPERCSQVWNLSAKKSWTDPWIFLHGAHFVTSAGRLPMHSPPSWKTMAQILGWHSEQVDKDKTVQSREYPSDRTRIIPRYILEKGVAFKTEISQGKENGLGRPGLSSQPQPMLFQQ